MSTYTGKQGKGARVRLQERRRREATDRGTAYLVRHGWDSTTASCEAIELYQPAKGGGGGGAGTGPVGGGGTGPTRPGRPTRT